MHFAVIAMLQVLCCIHAYRSGQERYWIFVIFCFPVLGCVIYFIMVMVPETGAERHGRSLMARLLDNVNPERHLRKLTQELAIAGTSENHSSLANELARLGRYHEAIPLYRKALSGIFSYEPSIMLCLAKAEFATQNFSACQKTLQDLIHHNPDFQSAEGHLIFARTLAAQAQYDEAEQEFAVLVNYFPGPEARIHFADMLARINRLHEANDHYVAIIDTAKCSRPQYRKYHREWIKIANERLKQSVVR